MRFPWVVAGAFLSCAALPGLCREIDKPTGNPLTMSDIETEQPIPLAYLSPDGKTAACTRIRLHWSPSPSTSADDAASLTLDLAPEQPGAATFAAQFWNASLAGSLAWQKPWQGAHWKIFDTPATDGTGIDAGLAVGMIATSARRPYPKDTLVIGNLHPDSSLGQVTRIIDRLDAAAHAGVTRVIIPQVEQSATDSAGHVVDVVQYAEQLNLTCVPVDNIVEATEAVMNDPLPDPPTGNGPPKYSADVASYIDGFAQREQTEAASALLYAPKENQLGQYPPRQAAAWKQIYAEIRQGQQAYKSGEVYVAYRLLARANSRMQGLQALSQDQLGAFDVKAALETSEQLQTQLHYLMTPPPIDRGELQSAMLVAEMADWAYEISALLEGSELVTKQTFSQRSDATPAERDRAREAILSANEEARYLLEGSGFFTGLLPHLGDVDPLPANSNAMNLLPQLIPAQLATAQIFADGIRPQADELRVGLLFDPRMAAYVNVLREETVQWNESQRRRANAALNAPPTNSSVATVAVTAATNDATATNAPPENVTPLVATNSAPVGFDPGTAYAPPHTEVEVSSGDDPHKKLSDVAQCLIWVNTDCEIATLDQKYLRLGGTIDPATHEWHLKDRAQLDALLQTAQTGALQGAAFAQDAQVNPSIFGMIYERANYLRQHGDDDNGLASLRNYWRCALLGNMCWQLSHTHKAAAVDLGTDDDKKGKDKKTADKSGKEKTTDKESAASTPATTTNAPPADTESTNTVETPAVPDTNAAPAETEQPMANTQGHHADEDRPAPPDITNVPPVPSLEEPAAAATNEPPVAPVANAADAVPLPPVAPVSPAADVVTNVPPAVVPADTNAAPTAEEPAYPRALPVELPANAAPAPANETNLPSVVVPVAKPAPDDAYTGGESNAPPPRAQPVEVPATNSPASIP
jgi:hypothetical protein